MAFTFSQLAQDVWHSLGKIAPLENFLATGGSTTTVVNGKVADREEGEDDNYCVDYTAVVVRDAGGASAAPEGEMQRVYLYNSGTYTYTVDTAFSTDVASGDEIMLANADIPLREMYRAANQALTKIGDIALVDTSLTTAADTTEYTLPVTLKRGDPYKVEVEVGDSDGWKVVSGAYVEPSLPGTTAILRLPQQDSGKTIRVVYSGEHPKLTAYSSTIAEVIHPDLMTAATVAEALKWYLNSHGGGEDFDKQRYNEALQDYETALMRHPVWKPHKAPKIFVTGMTWD